jgi:hypothetical protein
LREGLSRKYTTAEDKRIVHRWLGISWVFGKDDEFRKVTKLMEQGCHANLKELIDTLEAGLPIPNLILGMFLKMDLFLFKLTSFRHYPGETSRGSL